MISSTLLREARIEAGLSQSALADMVPCSEQTIKKCEAHKSAISAEIFFRAMQVCGCTVEIKRGPKSDRN